MRYKSTNDPIRIYNEILGGKWRLLILSQLFVRTQRFKDLNTNIEGITPRMLTKELRIMEKYNLVEKEVYREVPPRVEYSLTDEGIKLYPLIENIIQFGQNFAYLLDENYVSPSIEIEENNEEIDGKEKESIHIEPIKIQEVVIDKIEPTIKYIEVPVKKTKQPKKPKTKPDDNNSIQLELF